MKVLVIEPHKEPEIRELTDLKDMQKCVGGYIQAVYPWDDIPAALVCDDEGLYHDADWNRYICEGMAIKGTFFICGLGVENFDDLPDELIERFKREFAEPETFIRISGGVAVINSHGVRAVI